MAPDEQTSTDDVADEYEHLEEQEVEDILENAEEGADGDAQITAETKQKLDIRNRVKARMKGETEAESQGEEGQEAAEGLEGARTADAEEKEQKGSDEDESHGEIGGRESERIRGERAADGEESEKAEGDAPDLPNEEADEDAPAPGDEDEHDPEEDLFEKAGERIDSQRGVGSGNANSGPATEKAWVPYQGPEGGEGWQNVANGEVRYQNDPPGDTIDEGDMSVEDLEGVSADDAANIAGAMDIGDEFAENLADELGVDPEAGVEEFQQAASENPEAVAEALVESQGGSGGRLSAGGVEVGDTITAEGMHGEDQTIEVEEIDEGGSTVSLRGTDENGEERQLHLDPDDPVSESDIVDAGGLSDGESEALDILGSPEQDEEWERRMEANPDADPVEVAEQVREDVDVPTEEPGGPREEGDSYYGAGADAGQAAFEEIDGLGGPGEGTKDLAKDRLTDMAEQGREVNEENVRDALSGLPMSPPDIDRVAEAAGEAREQAQEAAGRVISHDDLNTPRGAAGALEDAGYSGSLDADEINGAWDDAGLGGSPPDWVAGGASHEDLANAMTEAVADAPDVDDINRAANAVMEEVRGDRDSVDYDTVSEVLSSDAFDTAAVDATQLVEETAEQLGVDRGGGGGETGGTVTLPNGEEIDKIGETDEGYEIGLDPGPPGEDLPGFPGVQVVDPESGDVLESAESPDGLIGDYNVPGSVSEEFEERTGGEGGAPSPTSVAEQLSNEDEGVTTWIGESLEGVTGIGDASDPSEVASHMDRGREALSEGDFDRAVALEGADPIPTLTAYELANTDQEHARDLADVVGVDTDDPSEIASQMTGPQRAAYAINGVGGVEQLTDEEYPGGGSSAGGGDTNDPGSVEAIEDMTADEMAARMTTDELAEAVEWQNDAAAEAHGAAAMDINPDDIAQQIKDGEIDPYAFIGQVEESLPYMDERPPFLHGIETREPDRDADGEKMTVGEKLTAKAGSFIERHRPEQ